MVRTKTEKKSEGGGGDGRGVGEAALLFITLTAGGRKCSGDLMSVPEGRDSKR